jgi:hypothetical protein
MDPCKLRSKLFSIVWWKSLTSNSNEIYETVSGTNGKVNLRQYVNQALLQINMAETSKYLTPLRKNLQYRILRIPAQWFTS